MKHKLTKFQLDVWNKIEPIVKENDYKAHINFDDDFVITSKGNLGESTITISPKKEIHYTLDREEGGVESEFFGIRHLDDLIKKL